MQTVSERLYQMYQVRREVSQPPDLATLLLARLVYDVPARLPGDIAALVKNMPEGQLEGLVGRRAASFGQWLYSYLVVNKTVKGVSFYPVHPLLTLPGNGEGTRVDGFLTALARSFTVAERNQLCESLWSADRAPAFERALHDAIQWQMPSGGSVPAARPEQFVGCDLSASPLSAVGILARTKEDLLALTQAPLGVQGFVALAGRLLALTLSRYLLAQAGVDLEIPIYAAPAADSHEGVRTLAHDIVENHRARFAASLRQHFFLALEQSLAEAKVQGDPGDERAARELVRGIFRYNANIIPEGTYARQLAEHGSFAEAAFRYYWSHSGASNRFLRQLHSAHLNLAKKAGLASSRSRYSQWHFYWFAPALVETLVLVSRPRLAKDRVLVADLLRDWRERYGLAVLIDPSWEDVYRRSFRGMGSPESLNEANRRRFLEILSERGRLHKNSDDFPWIVLRD
jgi:hypothetical protein